MPIRPKEGGTHEAAAPKKASAKKASGSKVVVNHEEQ